MATATALALTAAAGACSSSHPSNSGNSTSTSSGPNSTPSTTAGSPPVTAAGASGQWTTYANGNLRLGVASDQPGLAPDRVVWSARLDGAEVYAQPLIYGGRVFVVTEDDDVYALDARTGAVDWQVTIGQPLHHVSGHAGCGDVDPLGITSTPVIDAATSTLYVVGEISTAGAPPVHHQLVGLDLNTGRVTASTSADPPLPAGESPLSLLQRDALALANGQIYVGYGGNYGDCGSYHGWVVGIAVAGQQEQAFNVTPSSSGGAVWQGGAGPSVDAGGNLYITTGNPNSGGPAPYSEAIVKLSPNLAPEAAAQDPAATQDEDLGTGDVILLPHGLLFAVGKTDHGFLLNQSNLGPAAEVDGQVCGSDPDGGLVYDSATDSVYIPCRDGGIQQVEVANHRTGWRAGDVNSTPLLLNGRLWALQYPSGTLEELDPATGTALRRLSTGRAVPNFASLAAADGVLIAGTKSGVVAFGQ
jgi:hypothetical protein